MEAWAKEFIVVWEKNRQHFSEVGIQHLKNNPLFPVKEYTLNDGYQLFDGTTAMMREVLEGTGSDVRDMYFNTVIPGALEQGNTVSGFVAQVTLIAILYTSMLVPQMKKNHRDQAAQFMANFYMNFNYQIVKIGIEMGAKA